MNDMTLFSTVYASDTVAVITTAAQTDTVKQWISMAITILAGIFSIALTIIKIIKWWKDAKKDGKIDDDEIDDLEHILEDGQKDLTDKANKEDK